MVESLLRECVALMAERVRSKQGTDPQLGDHFDLARFKKLKDASEMRGYASNFLETLGRGSSRIAFILNSRQVLKIALNDKGLGQNEAELDVYTNPESRPIVAKIYDSGPRNSWLISDLVRPITDQTEFEKLTGVRWSIFSTEVRRFLKGNKDEPVVNSNFLRSVINTAISNRMLAGDIARGTSSDPIDHWGKTADGRVVLLDYGLTREVWAAHYEPKRDDGDRAAMTVPDRKRG